MSTKTSKPIVLSDDILAICKIRLVNSNQLTSILALVQRGTSTTMLNVVFSASAYSGMSWNGEMNPDSFATVTLHCQLAATFIQATTCTAMIAWPRTEDILQFATALPIYGDTVQCVHTKQLTRNSAIATRSYTNTLWQYFWSNMITSKIIAHI